VLDHVSIPVTDVDRAVRFYEAVLATIGLRRRKERPRAIGYGPKATAAPVFWILERQRKESASPAQVFT
jgi:catechol 2,3-dioxygenase-like lactoylglutathione lyase family enzyme